MAIVGTINRYKCDHCGHTWTPRKAGRDGICPACHCHHDKKRDPQGVRDPARRNRPNRPGGMHND